MIEVRMSPKAKDLRIKNFKSLSHFDGEGKIIGSGTVFLSEFLGIPHNQILDFRIEDVKKMIATALKAFSGMDLTSELPKTITLSGQKFVLIDPNKIGIGWHMDHEKADIVRDPVGLACLYYVQEGYNYSDEDENGNILYPISSRREIFEKEFPLDLFIRAANFFLVRSLNSRKQSMEIDLISLRIQKRINLLRRLITYMSGKLQFWK